MENIKLIDGKIYESQDVEINLAQLESELAASIASIAEQQALCDEKQAKINYIKSLTNK